MKWIKPEDKKPESGKYVFCAIGDHSCHMEREILCVRSCRVIDDEGFYFEETNKYGYGQLMRHNDRDFDIRWCEIERPEE